MDVKFKFAKFQGFWCHWGGGVKIRPFPLILHVGLSAVQRFRAACDEHYRRNSKVAYVTDSRNSTRTASKQTLNVHCNVHAVGGGWLHGWESVCDVRHSCMQEHFKCPYDERCRMDVCNRRFCKRCRLNKCFQIGMRKEYILTEEEKAQKRLKIEANRCRLLISFKASQVLVFIAARNFTVILAVGQLASIPGEDGGRQLPQNLEYNGSLLTSDVISRPWSRDSSALEFILSRSRSRSWFRDLKKGLDNNTATH